ncbi:hypothetical protein [Pseudomonas sp.]|jgi:hypothetical protein|uniref:DUF7210 family protein n=1 Tax=Pseudomonas sp. TaxID=306 RepID=UPI000C89CE57|nr:hypothetical protein [Pseudomonadales bacterium]|tara:strand:+ start:1192 stop:1371 length:180 start_codon:yes stop_codon:yes gene_type:complete
MSKTIKVTLVKDHKHAGVPHKAGAKIDVTEPTRDWLLGLGVIEAAAPVVEDKPKTGGAK